MMRRVFQVSELCRADSRMAVYGTVDVYSGEMRRLSIADLVEQANSVILPDAVPDNIRSMFDVAKGAYIYGWFYYPLFTLAIEHCHRIVEAAVRHKYRTLGGPPNPRQRPVPLRKQLTWLRDQGVIPNSEWGRWDASIELRNFFSHPDGQTILMPTDAFMFVDHTASKLITLYS